MNGRRDYHFAYVIAKNIDSVASANFLKNLDGNQSGIVVSKLSKQFKIFNFNGPVDCKQVTNKVVIFGYLGPTNEDKLTTYARYHNDSENKGPDMYGSIVVSNQILLILKDDLTVTSMNGVLLVKKLWWYMESRGRYEL